MGTANVPARTLAVSSNRARDAEAVQILLSHERDRNKRDVTSRLGEGLESPSLPCL